MVPFDTDHIPASDGGVLLGIRWFFRDLLCPKWRYALYVEQQSDGHWTAESLSVIDRQFDADYDTGHEDWQDYRDMDTLTTWTAETEDMSITVQDSTSLAVQGAFHNGWNHPFYDAYLIEDLPRTSNPDSDANFSAQMNRYTYEIPMTQEVNFQ